MLRYFNIDHLRVLNGFQHFDALGTLMRQSVKGELTFRDRKNGVSSTYN